MPYFLHKFLKVSLSPSLYGTVMEPLHVGLLFWLLFLLFLRALIFVFILLMAQIGYLHSTKASWICFCSSSNNSWLEHMSLALCSNDLITLYLLDTAWWLSHFRYWLVSVGFLYTFVCRLPSLFGVIRVSRNGMDPSSLVFSTVNLMWLSREFKWWKNSSLYDVSRMTKVSSTNLFHRLGGCGADSRACSSKCSIRCWLLWGFRGCPLLPLPFAGNIDPGT